jgi:hypothetical protein
VQPHVSGDRVMHRQLTPLNSPGDSVQVSDVPPSIWRLCPFPSEAEGFAAMADLRERTEKLGRYISLVENTQEWLAGQEVDYYTIGGAVFGLQVNVQNAESRVQWLDFQIAYTGLPPTRNQLDMVNEL